MRHHSELAHVALSNVDCRVPHQVCDARQLPGSRCPWVFVQEMSTLLNLELVESTTEFNMFDRFLSFSVEFLCPTRFAAMDCLVQFL